IVFKIENIGDGSSSCAGALFGISFDMVTPAGTSIGTGVSCAQTFAGCNFAAGCRDSLGTTWTLNTANGSLTGPVTIDEAWPTDSFVVQLDNGALTTGTGAFAGSTGTLHCAGTVRFTATDAIPQLNCVAVIR